MTAGIAACSSDNKEASGQQGAVSYSETEIGSSSGIKAPGGSRTNSKGRLVFLDSGVGPAPGFVVLDADGKPAGKIKCSVPGYAMAFTLDAKDNIYVLLEKDENGSPSFKIGVLGPAGETIKEIDLSGLQGAGSRTDAKSRYFTDIAMDTTGNIYLDDPTNGIQILDKDGKLLKSIDAEGYRSMDMGPDGNLLAECFADGKRTIGEIEAATGKSIWSAELAKKSSSFSLGSDRIRYSKKDNCIYVMDSQGIGKYDMSGKPAGEVLDFRDHAILTGGYGISDMCVDVSGNIFVTALSSYNDKMEMKYEIYRYSRQSGEAARKSTEKKAGESASSKKQTIITVSVPRSDSMLDMAISRFQQANPGYKVNVETYPSQGETGSMDTYIKNLNTQILSGKGPDIMSVAWLPFRNYASKNILADLGDMMAQDKDFDTGKYYSNIFEALKVDSKLYVLPTDFCFDVLMANQAVLDKQGIKIDDGKWTWSDFKTIAQKVVGTGGNKKLSALPSLSPNDILDLFTGGIYNNYFDMDKKSASFSSKGFIDLLSMAKDFGSLSDSSIENDMVHILEAAQRGSLVFLPYTYYDYSMYAFMKHAYNDQMGLYRLPSVDGGSKMTFTSGSLYAINANSNFKPECWKLLKTLLSDEVQMSGTGSGGFGKGKSGRVFILGGFSINKAAQQKNAQRTIEGSKNGSIMFSVGGPSGKISLNPSVMTQNDIEYMDKFINSLTAYAYYDDNIGSIVGDETKAFFSGAKSAEDTAKLIQDRVSTYLGE